MSRDGVKFVLCTAAAIGLVEVSNAAGWSDQTSMGVGLGLIAVMVLSFFFYDALRPEQRRP